MSCENNIIHGNLLLASSHAINVQEFDPLKASDDWHQISPCNVKYA